MYLLIGFELDICVYLQTFAPARPGYLDTGEIEAPMRSLYCEDSCTVHKVPTRRNLLIL